MLLELIILFFSIVLLLILSAFFSGSETALTASTRSRLTGLSIKGHKNAKTAIELLNKKEALIGAILLGNNLVNILASALATSLLIKFFGDTGVAYAVIIMTALIVLFAEILPKSYAITNSEKLALIVSPIFKPIVYFLWPVTWMMEKIVFYILRIFNIKLEKDRRVLSVEDEIRGTLDLHHKEGRLYKSDKDMVTGVLDLAEVTVEDVMVHRSNMFIVNIDDDPKKSGVKKEEIYSFFEYCLSKGNNPIGIMTIPSIDSQPEIVFSNMQNINEKLKKNYGYQGELSMGMSNDYEIALDYGATIVRIGTKLFK